MNVTILVVDDHELFRFGLKSALEYINGFKVVGEAADGRSAVKLALEIKPSIVLMDISMPNMNGIDATREIVKNNSDISVIGLSMHSDPGQVEQMFRNGAKGYILKDCSFSEFEKCIKNVAQGYTYLCPKLLEVVDSKVIGIGSGELPGNKKVELTPREKEVLRLITDGKTNNQIAETLIVAVKTVDTHRKKIMDKLGIRTVAGLTKYALREGLTCLETTEQINESDSKEIGKTKDSLHNTKKVKLTPREREVLQLIAEGNTNKQIAEALIVSVKTVETHRGKIMNKLGIRSVAGLTKYALGKGLTSLEF